MNLKEAFRFQNKLTSLLDEVNYFLGDRSNVTKTKRVYLYNKVDRDTENVTEEILPENYADAVADMVKFAVYLVDTKEQLALAIRKAKASADIDIDSETGLNQDRQALAKTLRQMSNIKAFENIAHNAGTGYRFNNEGNQVMFKCDVETTVTINFDRDKVRKAANNMSDKADAVSAKIDEAVITTQVDFDPPFNINDSFDDIFEEFVMLS